ncbi:MAG: NYN domain-containing protein [bacterium]
MDRVAIFIDGNNFYKGCQLNFNRTDIDFRKLGEKLCQAVGASLLRIYYYNAHVSKELDPLGYQKQQKFFDNLRANSFITLRLGHLVYHRLRTDQGGGFQYFPTEKGIDVQIAVDMIRLALLKACDGIILVSGDSDYIYAVRFVKDLGCYVFISSFPIGGSIELRNEGDGFVIMDHDFIQSCFIRPSYLKTDEMTRRGAEIIEEPNKLYEEDRERAIAEPEDTILSDETNEIPPSLLTLTSDEKEWKDNIFPTPPTSEEGNLSPDNSEEEDK